MVGIDSGRHGGHRERAKLDLGLALEHRLLDIQRDGCHDTCTDVAILEVLLEELLDGLGNMFLESTLVGSALRGVLTIDKRIVLLAILIGMGEGNLDILSLQMDDGIEGIGTHAVLEQVLQTTTAEDAATIIHNGETGVQIGIVAKHVLHDVIVELIVLEQRIIGLEVDIGAVLVVSLLSNIVGELAFLKCGLAHHAITERVNLEVDTQRIDGLDTHTIQANRLLEGL